jgi:hypothetical protein
MTILEQSLTAGAATQPPKAAKIPAVAEAVAAKNELVDVLVEDKLGQWNGDISWLYEIAKNGFRGFSNMAVAELIACVEDANLLARNSRVGQLVDILEAAQYNS